MRVTGRHCLFEKNGEVCGALMVSPIDDVLSGGMFHGRCSCGAVKLEARHAPPVRFFCHCTTCQRIYGQPFADITAVWSWHVKVSQGAEALAYERHSWFPASVKRGLCGECSHAVIGHLQVPVAGICFVPSAIWEDEAGLPEPAGHIFWHSRVEDVDDDLPKVSGLYRSELAATGWMLPRLLRGTA